MEELERTDCVETTAAAMPTKAQMRRAFSRMALGLCIGLLVSQFVISNVIAALLPAFDIQTHSFLLGGLSTGLFTLPMMLLVTTSLPICRPERHSLSFGAFLVLLCVSYAGMIAGNLVGIGVNSLLSPGSLNLIESLATASGISVETFVAFVVLPPVFEELVFRKVLVDRALPYGEWPAIVFSGLVFGLFHGNLTQFFYAVLLGMILAYVYVRTGNILYPIAIHACINFLGGILPQLFPAASVVLLLAALAGLVFLIVFWNRIHVARNAVPGVGGAMFGNGGMIVYLCVCGLLMALVALVMSYPELLSGLT